MSWRQKLRALLGRSTSAGQAESMAALEAASRSRQRAEEDHSQASATRAEADVWAQRVRDHNTANRYNEFLARVMRGDS